MSVKYYDGNYAVRLCKTGRDRFYHASFALHSVQTQKSPTINWSGFLLHISLTMSYFHTGTRTIIGAEAFHCPVRDGKEWDHLAMVIKLNWLPSCLQQESKFVKSNQLFLIALTRHNTSTESNRHQSYRVKPHEQLVPVSLTHYYASTPGLSTSWSRTTLQGAQGPGRSHLETSFPLRCFQRLSLPHLATRQCHWRDNRYTRGASTPVLSY